MVNSEAVEFPFVEQLPRLCDLPKRERTKLQRVWDRFQELSKISQQKGLLVPIAFGSKILDVSRQRTYELIASGRLEVIEVDGHQFLTESSVVAYAQTERKAGRPPKTLVEAQEKGMARTAFKLAREYATGK